MTALIVVAAGSGQRLGAPVPKALVEVAGDTLIGHCLTTAQRVPQISQTIVVVPQSELKRVRDQAPDVEVVAGGVTRDESVRAGLEALRPDTQEVLIHDAARPFAPAEVFERVLAGLRSGVHAVIPAVPVADTIKKVREGLVVHTVDRTELVAVQTPQGFRVDTLRDAHQRQAKPVTDDAMLMEDLGIPVAVVTGSHEAFKITTPFDLAVARAMREG